MAPRCSTAPDSSSGVPPAPCSCRAPSPRAGHSAGVPSSAASARTSTAAERHFQAAEAALAGTLASFAAAEAALSSAVAAFDAARELERQAVSAREETLRHVASLQREVTSSEQQLERLRERLQSAERRVAEISTLLEELGVGRARRDEAIGAARTQQQALETEQETAREQRVHWQVQEAHVAARLRAAVERAERVNELRAQAAASAAALARRARGARSHHPGARTAAGRVAHRARRASRGAPRARGRRHRHRAGARGGRGQPGQRRADPVIHRAPRWNRWWRRATGSRWS